ncbi:polysaccharide pyruvyl transferase family protein [Anaerocolumna sp. AGMB13020]|uniref:polysaccharide pyruvyl transferase family protein n=1 Tax=Anaerocolumna sp. AGMB13020 TaxID=3081750 RepID=UPI002952DA78|nr:polysaccharide pyruvyl transferase family protein [Anaerocolumna sp. AGMB13020]WOO38854.1 polysaccharide pyruvyl transferase family protein [Anaerocolumna sp. AGMB13020]
MGKKIINVGLYDMDFFDLNFGVNALGICHVLLLDNICKKIGIKARFTVFTPESADKVVKLFRKVCKKELDIVTVRPISIRHPKVFINFFKEVKKCDFVIDATGGDSFSDIYGDTRFIRGTICKLVTAKRSRLLLAPQTIGPFKKKRNEKFAVAAINRSESVSVRDKLSYEYVNKIAPGAKLHLASDVAMSLPFDSQLLPCAAPGKINVGINISGLLWNGGYTGDNQFGLALDYKKFMTKVIEKYASDDSYQVHLIAHVIEDGAYEDDFIVCRKLSERYPTVTLAPKFLNVIEAKNYICHMDVFAGARMHATIGAFSSGVATIPISYSRKFEGVFGSIGYKVNIDCKKLSTEEAYQKFLYLVEHYRSIQQEMTDPLKEARKRTEAYADNLARMVQEIIT